MKFPEYRKYYFYLHGYQLPGVVNLNERIDDLGESQEIAHLVCGIGRVLQIAKLESFQGVGVSVASAPDVI